MLIINYVNNRLRRQIYNKYDRIYGIVQYCAVFIGTFHSNITPPYDTAIISISVQCNYKYDDHVDDHAGSKLVQKI